MQTQMVRTTVTMPQALLNDIKHEAVEQKKTVSKIIVDKLTRAKKTLDIPVQNPLEMLGKYKLGIKSKFRREDMYEEYLKHKVSF